MSQNHLFVREFGQGDPVLVLSGLGMQSWYWLPFLWSHRKNFHFIIPDWRGFGRSKDCHLLTQSNAITQHWQDLKGIIDDRGLRNFKVIAYSMGATIAMHGMKYADFASHIKDYLHIDQSPKIQSDMNWPYGLYGQQYQNYRINLNELYHFLDQHQHSQYTHELSPSQLSELYQHWKKVFQFSNDDRYLPFERFKTMQSLLLPTRNLDHLRWYLFSYIHHSEDYREALFSLKCPIHFFMGQRSLLYPIAGQRWIAAQCKQVTTVEFSRSGHAPMLTEALKFNRHLKEFLYQKAP